MAFTFTKRTGYPCVPSNSYMSLIERQNYLEGASQTYVNNAPLAFSSGYLIEFVAPATAKLAAYATVAGHNTAAGVSVAKCILATHDVEFQANLLGAAAADLVLLQTHLGTSYDLLKSTTLEGTGKPGWYVSAATADACMTVAEFNCDQAFLNPRGATPTYPTAGDTNARLTFRLTPTKGFWF